MSPVLTTWGQPHWQFVWVVDLSEVLIETKYVEYCLLCAANEWGNFWSKFCIPHIARIWFIHAVVGWSHVAVTCHKSVALLTCLAGTNNFCVRREWTFYAKPCILTNKTTIVCHGVLNVKGPYVEWWFWCANRKGYLKMEVGVISSHSSLCPHPNINFDGEVLFVLDWLTLA